MPRDQTTEQAVSDAIHLAHCNQGEWVGACKYGEDLECPAMGRQPRPWREELDRFLQTRPELRHLDEASQFKCFMKLREISVQVIERYFWGLSELPLPLESVIAALQQARDQIPEEYRASATVAISPCADWGTHGCVATVAYRRPRREDVKRLSKMEETSNGQ